MRIKNDAEERAEIERIYTKEARGEKLTGAELARKAYSRFGTAGGCPSIAFHIPHKCPDYPPAIEETDGREGEL